MKRIFTLFCILMLSTTIFAQVRGGEINRKPNTEQNTNKKIQTTVNKRNNSNSHKGINRNLDGATLGKTTKQEIINQVKSNHLSYQLDENGKCVVVLGDYSFGGVSWHSIKYRFYNNILWQVVFSKTGNGPSGSTIVFDYSNLRSGLLRKYKEYYSPIFADDLSFSDGNTYIAVFGGKPEVDQKLQLRYSDASIQKIINASHKTDL